MMNMNIFFILFIPLFYLRRLMLPIFLNSISLIILHTPPTISIIMLLRFKRILFQNAVLRFLPLYWRSERLAVVKHFIVTYLVRDLA